MINSLKCDKDGVPELVQSVRYQYGNFAFKVTFFNGSIMFIYGDAIPSLDLCESKPSQQHFNEVYRILDKHPEFYVRATKAMEGKYD